MMMYDASLLGAGLLVAALTSPGGVPPSPFGWLVAFPILALVLLHVRGIYTHRPLRLQILDDVRVVVTTTATAAMIILSLRVLLADDAAVAGQVATEWAFASVFLAGGRAVLGSLEIRARQRGEVARATLIVGAGKVGRRLARRLLQYPELGLLPVGFLDEAPLDDDGGPVRVPVLGGYGDLDFVLKQHDIEQVIVTFSTARHDVLLRLVKRCEELGVSVSFVPRLFENIKENVRIDLLGGLPLMSVKPTNPKGWHFTTKYAIDRVVAAGLLILLSPLVASAAVAIWLSSGRPILYRQLRVGRDGRLFHMLKFRSMEPEAKDEADLEALPPDTAPGGVQGEDRRTRVGALLRRTSLDELPQLINVLRGEMSLVGPRPERPEFVAVFERDVHRYGDRHRVKAGITGWAQINGLRGRTSLADRVEWDNYYIDNWSLWLDLKILLSTVTAVVRFRAE